MEKFEKKPVSLFIKFESKTQIKYRILNNKLFESLESELIKAG